MVENGIDGVYTTRLMSLPPVSEATAAKVLASIMGIEKPVLVSDPRNNGNYRGMLVFNAATSSPFVEDSKRRPDISVSQQYLQMGGVLRGTPVGVYLIQTTGTLNEIYELRVELERRALRRSLKYIAGSALSSLMGIGQHVPSFFKKGG